MSEANLKTTTTTGRRSIAAGGIAMLLLAASAAGEARAEELANIPPANPDAELLRLGEMLEEAWQQEVEAYALATDKDDETPEAIRADALNDVTAMIVYQIEGMRALTLEGLQVKLRAVIWCHSGDPITAATFGDGHNPATATRLLVELLDDLSTMGARA